MLLKKWIIGASTVAALSIGGYKVGTWNPEKGYPIIDTTKTEVIIDTAIEIMPAETTIAIDTIASPDTIWFTDSVKLVKFARFGQARFGKAQFVPKEELN